MNKFIVNQAGKNICLGNYWFTDSGNQLAETGNISWKPHRDFKLEGKAIGYCLFIALFTKPFICS